MENKINFVTSDNVILSAHENIRNILRAPCMNSQQVSLPEVSSAMLTLVLEYCYYHNFTNPPKIRRSSTMNDLKDCLNDEGDFNFLARVANEGNYEAVANLLLVATKLGCEGLEDLCYTYLGFYFRSLSVQDLKTKVFKLEENEFTDKDYLQIKEENNKWLMVLTEDRIEELDNN